jgi:hypothetical protein
MLALGGLVSGSRIATITDGSQMPVSGALGALRVPQCPRTDLADSRKLLILKWSGRGDLNSGPPEPHSGALPGCATSRLLKILDFQF